MLSARSSSAHTIECTPHPLGVHPSSQPACTESIRYRPPCNLASLLPAAPAAAAAAAAVCCAGRLHGRQGEGEQTRAPPLNVSTPTRPWSSPSVPVQGGWQAPGPATSQQTPAAAGAGLPRAARWWRTGGCHRAPGGVHWGVPWGTRMCQLGSAKGNELFTCAERTSDRGVEGALRLEAGPTAVCMY